MNRVQAAGAAAVLMVAAFAGLAGAAVTGDEVLAQAWIPSAASIHGVTRLLRCGESACLQTVLHSPSFRRGVREILTREAAWWPPERPGADDSAAFRAALSGVKDTVVAQPRADLAADAPYTLLMEFVFRPGASEVVFRDAGAELSPDVCRIEPRAVWMRLPVSDVYMSRAQLIMARAAWGDEVSDLPGLLGQAGWIDLAERADPAAVLPVR
jgi:hypothetical protein